MRSLKKKTCPLFSGCLCASVLGGNGGVREQRSSCRQKEKNTSFHLMGLKNKNKQIQRVHVICYTAPLSPQFLTWWYLLPQLLYCSFLNIQDKHKEYMWKILIKPSVFYTLEGNFHECEMFSQFYQNWYFKKKSMETICMVWIQPSNWGWVKNSTKRCP